MKKFVVETYYTCTFKTVHTLDNLDDKELSKIDDRTDGNVEVIDVDTHLVVSSARTIILNEYLPELNRIFLKEGKIYRGQL